MIRNHFLRPQLLILLCGCGFACKPLWSIACKYAPKDPLPTPPYPQKWCVCLSPPMPSPPHAHVSCAPGLPCTIPNSLVVKQKQKIICQHDLVTLSYPIMMVITSNPPPYSFTCHSFVTVGQVPLKVAHAQQEAT